MNLSYPEIHQQISFLNVCNGYQYGVPKPSPVLKATMDTLLPQARERFLAWRRQLDRSKAWDYHFQMGFRFDDNNAVLLRILSAASEEEVLKDPMAWALDGLRECAMADHWYEYEKDWGN